jgi:hypothetical protein
MRIAIHGWVVAGLLAFSGCGESDPADVAGEYTIAVTSRENGCNFANWMEGNTSSNIPVTITQEGSDATATVNGLTGGFLDLILGSRIYTGGVGSDNMLLTLFGTTTANEGNCTYTVNSIMDANISGDVLTGEIRYEAATNGNPDCAALEGCVSRQDFNGTRPPQ